MKKTIVTIALLVGSSSFASVMLNLGLRNTTPTTNVSTSLTGKVEYQFGAIYNHEFGSEWALRTGANYTPRTWIASTATATTTYLDIPLTARYTFNTDWSAFTGLILANKIAFSGTNGVTDNGYKSMATPLTLGGTYVVAAGHGLTAEYEMTTEYASAAGTTINYSNLSLTYQYAF